MKISLVGPFPPFRGGIANFNSSLADALSQRHTVKKVSFTTQYPKFLFPGKSQFQSPQSSTNNNRILSSINPLTWKRSVKQILATEPDVVIFSYWMPFFAPSFAALARRIKSKSGAKIMALCNNITPHEKRFLDNTLTKYFFRHVDYFMVMSKTVEADLHTLVSDPDYIYSPHPIYDQFGPVLTKEAARRQLNIDQKNIILFFGLIRAYKGLDILIKSTAVLKSHLKNFKVIVVGECYEDEDKYIEMVKLLAVEDVLDLRFGYAPESEVSKYFSAADLVVLPYKSATQSGIVPIAFNYNTPVVVTNVGGLPEIVPHGKAGYVVTPDPEAVAGAVIKYFKDNKYSEFSTFIETYKERFSWQTFVENLESLIPK